MKTASETPENSAQSSMTTISIRSQPQHHRIAHHGVVPDVTSQPPRSNYTCATPPPQMIPFHNATSNSITYLEFETPVFTVDVLFDYEIRHSTSVNWATKKGGQELKQLEKVMVMQVWNMLLQDGNMTWDDHDLWAEGECQGLVVYDDLRRRLQADIEGEENGTTTGDTEAELIPTETKLLGLDFRPRDLVNANGCINPSETCTAVLGKLSATYTGTNEFGVVQLLTSLVRQGCETGLFIAFGSPALMMDFRSSAEDEYAGSGQVVPLNTDPVKDKPTVEEVEEDYISKYGILFVCMLAILGTLCIAVFVVKRRRIKRRKQREMEEMGLGEVGLAEVVTTGHLDMMPEVAPDVQPDTMPKATVDGEVYSENDVEDGAGRGFWNKFGKKKNKSEPESEDEGAVVMTKAGRSSTAQDKEEGAIFDRVELSAGDDVEISWK